MAIVTGVPQTNIPSRSATIDNSQAVQATAGTDYNILIIGTKASGDGPIDEVVPIFGDSDGLQWGEGSIMDRMITIAKRANTTTPMFAIALAEDGGGTEAELATTWGAGTATANGTGHMYLGGQYTPFAIAIGDDEDAIAASQAAAIQAATGLPMTASATLAVCTSTAKWKGVSGGSVNIQFNRGIKEAFPAGIGVPVTVPTAGTGDPTIVPAIAAMVDVQYTHILLPFEDAPNQDLMEAELDTRFGPEDQKWGISFTAKQDSTANLLIYGATRNSQLQVSPEVDPGTASPNFECGASMVAVAAGEPDPARPLQTLKLTGVVGALDGVGLQRSRSERNALLGTGIGTTIVAVDGSVQIERFVTNYQTNPAGAPDESYMDLMTPLQVLVFRDAINAVFAQKYARHKLASDGNKFGAGQKVITPKIARAEIIAVFETFVTAAIMENVEQFKDDLIVERSLVDKNRIDYSCNPDTVNQFRVLAGVIAFIK